MTSFIYIINDIKDIDKDKKHPRKKYRPIPSGIISKNKAKIIACILIIVSILLNTILNQSLFNASFYFLVIYMLLNILYSFGLKNMPIIDITILASGFILRVYYGATIIGIEVSNWLYLTILCGSLFLGLGKRKKELENNEKSREVLKYYNEKFLDKFQYLTLGLTLVFYSLWTIDQNKKGLIISIPILIIIFMRYCLFIEKNDEGDPITILYQDKFLFIICVLYSLFMLIFLIL